MPVIRVTMPRSFPLMHTQCMHGCHCVQRNRTVVTGLGVDAGFILIKTVLINFAGVWSASNQNGVRQIEAATKFAWRPASSHSFKQFVIVFDIN